jgi:hypothetical protein
LAPTTDLVIIGNVTDVNETAHLLLFVGAWKSGGLDAIQATNLAIASFASSASQSAPMRPSSELVKFAWIA